MKRGIKRKRGTKQRVDNLVANPIGIDRARLATILGKAYGGKRNVYEALGYPEDRDLTFGWFLSRYDRQDIASAVIDRPVDKTWDGKIDLVEEGQQLKESKLSEEWKKLTDKFQIKKYLSNADKLAGIGRFSLLLFGFADVKKPEDFKRPVGDTQKVELQYLRPIDEGSISIDTWETDTSNPRYGLPRFYKIDVSTDGDENTIAQRQIEVHHSRVLHLTSGSLTSEVYGRPRLKPIANRLIDLEKLLGGDAEMFWRGARPGYKAIARENYDMGDPERAELYKEINAYEHDLRRFITAEGVDIEALAQQISDPMNHIYAQMQAISAQTGIPIRILIGSEKGELSSDQDKVQWLTLIKTRKEQFAEPEILKPFIDKCMAHGILTKVDDYMIVWEDMFSPSEKDRVAIGKERAQALKVYADSVYAGEVLPVKLAFKYLLGIKDEEIDSVESIAEEEREKEDAEGRKLEEEARRLLSSMPSNGNGNGQSPAASSARDGRRAMRETGQQNRTVGTNRDM